MKVSFDFGTQEHVDIRAVVMALQKIYEDADKCNVSVGKFSMYMSFFDEDGILQDVRRESDGASVDVVVRKTPYKRKPSNVEFIGALRVESAATGEMEDVASMYKKYTK